MLVQVFLWLKVAILDPAWACVEGWNGSKRDTCVPGGSVSDGKMHIWILVLFDLGDPPNWITGWIGFPDLQGCHVSQVTINRKDFGSIRLPVAKYSNFSLGMPILFSKVQAFAVCH